MIDQYSNIYQIVLDVFPSRPFHVVRAKPRLSAADKRILLLCGLFAISTFMIFDGFSNYLFLVILNFCLFVAAMRIVNRKLDIKYFSSYGIWKKGKYSLYPVIACDICHETKAIEDWESVVYTRYSVVSDTITRKRSTIGIKEGKP